MELTVVRVALATWVMCSLTSCYTVDYFDCTDISSITTYRMDKACHPRTMEDITTVEYTLLQKRRVMEMKGFSCRVTRSTLTEYCGAYSHTKLAKTPDIEVSFPVSPQACLNMVNTGVFTTPSGNRQKIQINAENIIKSEDKGTLTIGDNSVSCRGQSMKFDSYIVEDILEVSQFKVTIIKEKFLIGVDGRVETAADHLRLPNRCSVTSRGCQTHDTTFVWVPPRDLCNLEEVRTVHLEKDNNLLVDHINKVLLMEGPSVPSPAGCPTTLLWGTEYDELFLTKPGAKWPTMKNDVDISIFIRARDDYIAYEMEKKIADQQNQLQSQSCADALQDNQGQLVQLQGAKFMKRNGDAVEHVTCKSKQAPILENLQFCYDSIPIQGGFVKVPARTFTAHAAPRPCNTHFGLKILTREGIWIELNPEAKKIQEPAALPAIEHDLHHEDLSDGGIYTKTELDAWTRHIELGDIVDAVTKTITYGVCQAQDQCESHPDMPSYDLGILSQGIQSIPTSIWQTMDDSIRYWGSYVSLLVIFIEAWHFCLFAVMTTWAFTADGLVGAKALVYRILCGTRHEATRLARRHQRLKRRRLSDGAEGNNVFIATAGSDKEGPEL